MKEYVRDAVPALYPAMFFGPNKARRSEAKILLDEVTQDAGDLSTKERLLCLGSIGLTFWTWLTTRLNIRQQPRLVRIRYPATGPGGAQNMPTELEKSYRTNMVTVGPSSPVCSSSAESACKK